MAFSESQWFVFMALIESSSMGNTGAGRDICSDIQPPITTTKSPPTIPTTDSPYCSLVCSQEKAELFDSVCPCASATTTVSTTTVLTTILTTIPTTTPQTPDTCYYSTQRPAQLSSRTRRLYASDPVKTECDYPGVVGLFMTQDNETFFLCVGSLLEEDTILISEQCYDRYFFFTEDIYVVTDSYRHPKITSNITVDKNSVEMLDLTGSVGYFYTVKLNTNVTFDKRCVQPVCVPNINIPASSLNLDDCRIVGYGTIDKYYNQTGELNEIKVKVDPGSVGNMNLTIHRNDKETGMMCTLGDESAPLICSHRNTKEWVTVGVTVATGYPCSNMSILTQPRVTSLLREASNNVLHQAIQRFKYADPENFPGN